MELPLNFPTQKWYHRCVRTRYRCISAHGRSSSIEQLSLDEYVAGRGPASYEAVQDTGFSHGFGRLDYAVIGSAVGVSDANGIGQPETGTLEARLTVVPGPARFIPTHKGQGLPTSEIAALLTRSGSMKNSTYFALTPQSFTDFDWLAVLDSTAYDRGAPPLQQ